MAPRPSPPATTPPPIPNPLIYRSAPTCTTPPNTITLPRPAFIAVITLAALLTLANLLALAYLAHRTRRARRRAAAARTWGRRSRLLAAQQSRSDIESGDGGWRSISGGGRRGVKEGCRAEDACREVDGEFSRRFGGCYVEGVAVENPFGRTPGPVEMAAPDGEGGGAWGGGGKVEEAPAVAVVEGQGRRGTLPFEGGLGVWVGR